MSMAPVFSRYEVRLILQIAIPSTSDLLEIMDVHPPSLSLSLSLPLSGLTIRLIAHCTVVSGVKC